MLLISGMFSCALYFVSCFYDLVSLFPNYQLGLSIFLVRSFYVSICSLWLFNIAMENGPFIDGLVIKHGDFPWLC